MKNILIGLMLMVATVASAQYTPASKESTHATLTVTALTVGSEISSASNGSLDVTNVTSVVEKGDGLSHQTVITMAGVASAIADGGFEASQLLYTFPEGRISVEGVTVDLTLVTTTNFNASIADLYNFALGTVLNTDGDGTIGATSANLLANQSVDTASGSTTTNSMGAALAASAQFDGTTTATPVYLNWAIPAANDKGDNTLTPTGTITISWKNLGDY
jgi:hypothetical protein